jgi:hypothetical protein
LITATNFFNEGLAGTDRRAIKKSLAQQDNETRHIMARQMRRMDMARTNRNGATFLTFMY